MSASRLPPCCANPRIDHPVAGEFDLICTDPPYYDAIPYSDLMDFFHVWLAPGAAWALARDERCCVRRGARAQSGTTGENDGELIDDASRFGG